MGVAEQANAQRQAFRVRKLSSGLYENCNIVAYLFDIVRAIALPSRFEGEDIAERGLSPFDL